MPDNPREITPTQSWSVESLKNNRQPAIVRRIINSAIYVEKPVMPPLRKKSPILTQGDYTCRTIVTSDRSIKRCTCITFPKNCPCHPICELPNTSCDSSSSSSEVGSQITVKSKKPLDAGDMKLSLTSLHTDRTEHRAIVDPKEKDEIIQNWLRKKDLEKKKTEIQKARLKGDKEREKEETLAKEKESFNKWLARKKQQAERIEKEKLRKEEEKRAKEAENERRQKRNETSYQAWLRKKKRAELEKKIKEKLTVLQTYEEKQKRMEENEKAFVEWLEYSKNKPKPVPLNQGLKSLCSSMSITYINPVPWVPNLENPSKPASQ